VSGAAPKASATGDGVGNGVGNGVGIGVGVDSGAGAGVGLAAALALMAGAEGAAPQYSRGWGWVALAAQHDTAVATAAVNTVSNKQFLKRDSSSSCGARGASLRHC